MHSLYKLKERDRDLNVMASATKAANRVLNKTSSNSNNLKQDNKNDDKDNKDKETLAKAALAYELKLKSKTVKFEC